MIMASRSGLRSGLVRYSSGEEWSQSRVGRTNLPRRLTHAGIDAFLSVTEHGVGSQGDDGKTIETVLVLVLSYDRRRLHACDRVVVSLYSKMRVEAWTHLP